MQENPSEVGFMCACVCVCLKGVCASFWDNFTYAAGFVLRVGDGVQLTTS